MPCQTSFDDIFTSHLN